MGDESDEATTVTTTTKAAKEIPVYRDEGFFTHHTGDTYDGSYEIKKKDHSVKMFGPGVYRTAEGDVYTATWEADKLSATEPVNIAFVDTASYNGPIKDFSGYSGVGTYSYPDESVLSCNFVENCPNGPLTLTDPNGHTWLGKAELGFGWFEPVNHFYTLLEKRENPRIKPRRRKTLDANLQKMLDEKSKEKF